MSKPNIRLFIKPTCPWCREAMDWLNARNIAYRTLDITTDPAARAEMAGLSGQTKVPTMQADGKILADFGEAELAPWWKEHFE